MCSPLDCILIDELSVYAPSLLGTTWVEVCHHLEIWNIRSTREQLKSIRSPTFYRGIIISLRFWIYQPAVLLQVGICDDDSVPIR